MTESHEHQRVVAFLLQLVGLYVRLFRLGELLSAPFAMRVTPESPAREPDLVFVAREHLARLTNEFLIGPADLIVEVVSDDSVYCDRVDKLGEYELAGVREYWIVDPRPDKPRAGFWVLDETRCYQSGAVGKDGIYHSTILPGFWLRVEWLVAEALPDPLVALAQVVGPEKIMETIRSQGG
jgi:Uma2 family endonuclease